MDKKISFYKYQGTGNDFILLDQMENTYELTTQQIENLCHRRFGIGADGLMMLRKAEGYDFEMVYYNSDGNRSTMCGNGGRCIVKFAFDLGYIGDVCSFLAVDGPHEAVVKKDNQVELGMIDVSDIKQIKEDEVFELFTGSPHYVKFVDHEEDLNAIVKEGRSVRYSSDYAVQGINVNLVYDNGGPDIQMATYERGVEDETYSCGTGVTAAAISHALRRALNDEIFVKTKGGNLRVGFVRENEKFQHVVLKGPALFVFKGEVSI